MGGVFWYLVKQERRGEGVDMHLPVVQGLIREIGEGKGRLGQMRPVDDDGAKLDVFREEELVRVRAGGWCPGEGSGGARVG